MLKDRRYFEQEEAEEIAKKLNTSIPGSISINFWVLPILKKLIERIENLEKKYES